MYDWPDFVNWQKKEARAMWEVSHLGQRKLNQVSQHKHKPTMLLLTLCTWRTMVCIWTIPKHPRIDHVIHLPWHDQTTCHLRFLQSKRSFQFDFSSLEFKFLKVRWVFIDQLFVSFYVIGSNYLCGLIILSLCVPDESNWMGLVVLLHYQYRLVLLRSL